MIPLLVLTLVALGVGVIVAALSLRVTAQEAAVAGRALTRRRVGVLVLAASVLVAAFVWTAQELGVAVAGGKCDANLSAPHVLEPGESYEALYGEGGAAVAVERREVVCLSFVDGRPL